MHFAKTPSRSRCHHLLKTFWGWHDEQLRDGPGFWTCLFTGLAPVAAAVAAHHGPAAAHPRAAHATLRRRDIVRIVVGDVALTVDYYLNGLASNVRLGDGGRCADHCGYRKPCANRSQE